MGETEDPAGKGDHIVGTDKMIESNVGAIGTADDPLQAEIIKAVRGIDDPDKLRKILEHTSDQLKLENFEKLRGA
jgi:hypothetical protein